MTPMVETPETPKQLSLAQPRLWLPALFRLHSSGIGCARTRQPSYERKFHLDRPSKPGFSKHVVG